MTMLLIRITCVFAVLLATAPRGMAGDLDSMRSQVRPEPTPPAETKPDAEEHKSEKKKKHKKHGHSHGWGGCDLDGFDDDSTKFLLIALGVTSPVWAPMAALEGGAFEYDGYFHRYPYADGAIGSMNRGDGDKGLIARFEAFDAHNLDSLNQVGGHLLIDTYSRLGIDTRWARFEEDLGGGGSDELVLGDVNAVFRFAQNDWVQMRIGVGMRAFLDNQASDYGVNVTYGAEIFPVKPFVITSTLDYARLGSADLWESRSTLGVMVNRFEIFTGYEFLRIGSSNNHFLIGGARVNF